MKKLFLKIFGGKHSEKTHTVREVASPLHKEKREHHGIIEEIEKEVEKDIDALEELVDDLIDDFCENDWTY